MGKFEEIFKFVDTYNRNIYRIYYHLYLSSDFNYCTILIITYFRACLNILSRGNNFVFE